MIRLQYKIHINCPSNKVYVLMLGITNKKNYEQWTSIFNPTSTYEGNWSKGSKMLFIGCDENGKKGGMISRITQNISGKLITIEHYGMIDGDNEITSGPEVDKWNGAIEQYFFEEINNKTLLTIELDTDEAFIDYFNETYPKALEVIKNMCENKELQI